jgi:hypothetical protein
MDVLCNGRYIQETETLNAYQQNPGAGDLRTLGFSALRRSELDTLIRDHKFRLEWRDSSCVNMSAEC